ncbi:lanthionine synthetase C family protein [Clostridium senegalense]
MIRKLKSFIEISDGTTDKIYKFLECFFKYIENQYDLKILNPMYYGDVLFVISEAYPILEDKEKWEKFAYDICKGIKQRLERDGTLGYSPKMMGNLGYMCFAVNIFKSNTGNLSRFSNSLNKLLLENSAKYADILIKKNAEVIMNEYDVVSGLSGALYYLLDFKWNVNEKKQLEKILEYLIGLTKYHKYKGQNVINFHITRENQFREDEKEQFLDGNLNFGLSHGMMGPLITMAKAYNEGIKIDGLSDAIEELFNIYEQFKKNKGDIPIWPTQLSYEDYIKGDFDNDIRPIMPSWCYGNVTIAKGMRKTAKYMKWIEKEKAYKKDLINIINQPIEDYNFYSPILCHGYAGVLCERVYAYREDKDKDFIKTIEENINTIISMFKKNESKIIEEYFEDLSFLQGTVGIVLSLLGVIYEDLNYGKLLLVD